MIPDGEQNVLDRYFGLFHLMNEMTCNISQPKGAKLKSAGLLKISPVSGSVYQKQGK